MPEIAQRTVTVLVLDDHALFRESLVRLLAAERDFEVVAHTGSIDEALTLLRRKHVDLILLDFDLGERDGTQFLRLAKRQGFAGKVLVVTAGVEEGAAVQLIHWGISGIFMKNNSAAMLAQGIRDVMAGKVWFDQGFLQAVVAGSARPPAEPQTMQLTQRERQVLLSVFEGMANKEIAERLAVSESSVKATLQQLFSKTGVRTRSQLVRIALEQYKNEL
jgi:two-component system, NarL family, nitrate/nitrite response regulator NarL